MKKLLILYLVVFLSLAGFVNAIQSCKTYDDFSNGLNLSKWEEIPGSDVNSLFVDEHYVAMGEQDVPYHTAQNSPADKGATLRIKNKSLLSGNIAEYDVKYYAGSGNRISVVELDGNYKWVGQIGFWNGVQQGGNDFGSF